MPQLGAPEVLDSLRADLKALLGRRRLEVVLLCDGAQELVDLLDCAFNEDSLGVRVHRLVDFWHVAEKLGAAATVLFGAAASGVLQRWKALLLNCERAPAHILKELYASGKREVRVGKERPVHAAVDLTLAPLVIVGPPVSRNPTPVVDTSTLLAITGHRSPRTRHRPSSGRPRSRSDHHRSPGKPARADKNRCLGTQSKTPPRT